MGNVHFKLLAVASVTLLTIAGCAAETADGDDEEVGSAEGAATSSVSLKYEGTCEFLRNCSTYSRGLPAGQVTWGCTGRGACDDNALWVAGPTRSYCGKTVKICNGSRCTNALVKDVSVSRDWEASNGVMKALSLPYGLTGRCSGYGGGRVTVSTNASGSSSSGSSSSGSTQPRRDGEDGSCWSSTLSQTVSELACVQSRSNGVWYQCKDGDWYRGVSGGDGPYGDCASQHRL
ncbi:MAG: hypothetical protein KF819_33730 [Labilithrix sp.]|nr:hypothetical protein [Labilithrix sp.]